MAGVAAIQISMMLPGAFGLLLALGSSARVAPCSAHELTLSFPSEPAEFTGMSHDGSWMVLRNTGRHTCTVSRLPALTLQDAAGSAVPVSRTVQAGMHPGPVLVSIRLRPGQSAKATLRWINGEVYDRSTCVDIATVRLNAPGGALSAPLKAHLCGGEPDGVHYQQEWLQSSTPKHSR